MSPAMSLLILSLLFATFLTNLVTLLAQSMQPVSSRITVVGAVFCDTCLDNGLSKHSYFLPGAEVHVRCKFNANSPRTAEMIAFSANRTTDNNGVYNLEIPSVDGVDCVDGPPIQSFCQAALIGSSISACNVPALKDTTTAISVKSKQENLCVYSFTSLSFKPRKRDGSLCGKQRKSLQSSSAAKLFTYPASLPFPFSTWTPSFPPLPPGKHQKQHP